MVCDWCMQKSALCVRVCWLYWFVYACVCMDRVCIGVCVCICVCVCMYEPVVYRYVIELIVVSFVDVTRSHTHTLYTHTHTHTLHTTKITLTPTHHRTCLFVFSPEHPCSTLVDPLSLSVGLLARSMTQLEWDLFVKVPHRELLHKRYETRDRSPSLRKCTEHLNNIVEWAAETILTAEGGARARSQLICRFIELALEFSKLNNFSGVLQVCACRRVSASLNVRWSVSACTWFCCVCVYLAVRCVG
jgi:RasGEF domain